MGMLPQIRLARSRALLETFRFAHLCSQPLKILIDENAPHGKVLPQPLLSQLAQPLAVHRLAPLTIADPSTRDGTNTPGEPERSAPVSVIKLTSPTVQQPSHLPGLLRRQTVTP